ncbi:hypothetical protein CWR43_04570 [Rhizobium sullae]|uniref:Uncharacterized protein n=1 Tax=Rhizobium sullae TaxID=50338 RepID=A0A2N0DG82_RHISU|nr:hypothetical protein CWR43_04570 [Rhizobium sullae]
MSLPSFHPYIFGCLSAACWKDGNRRGRHLFHNIEQRGYSGSFSNLERPLKSWRRATVLCMKPRGLLRSNTRERW